MSLRKAIEDYIEKQRTKVKELEDECELCNGMDMDVESGWCEGTEEVLDFLEKTLEKHPE